MEQTTPLIKNGILLCICQFSLSQEKGETKKESWDVSYPALSFKTVSITSDEGSWMSLDVSPDGTQIVFDMLGDIYTMPMSGGTATLIREGHVHDFGRAHRY